MRQPEVAVSVIVPVYNPGPAIERCIGSLLGQSLPPERRELIFVDDGSTDETPARLAEVAAAHSDVRVTRIPNSGWPGRPRNVGLGMASGEYVYFVDNDDWLGPEALERLHARATRRGADVVVGKVVGHGKWVPRELFRENRTDVTLEWEPLVGLLTPHKLFRRRFLEEHGLRFPEGRRRLEDHVFVLSAYFHARRVCVLADYPCYHWVLHADDANASYGTWQVGPYFDNVREVLDLVEAHTEPGPVRDRLLAHWYREKMLRRLGGGVFLERPPDNRRELYEAVRRLALERFPAEVNDLLPLSLRARARLVRDGRYDALEELAAWEREVRFRLDVPGVRREGSAFVLGVEGALVRADRPVAFERRGERVLWVPPAGLDGLPERDLDVSEELPRSRIEVFVRSPADRSEYLLPARVEAGLAPLDAGGEVYPLVSADARLDAATAAGGSRLPAGEWEVGVALTVGGITRHRVLRRPEQAGVQRLLFTVTPDGAIAERPLPARRRVRRVLRKVPLVGTTADRAWRAVRRPPARISSPR